MGYFNWRRKAEVHVFKIIDHLYSVRSLIDNEWIYYCGGGREGWRELQFNLG